MNKKGRSRELGRVPFGKTQNRVRLTTKIDKTLLRRLRRLATKEEKSLNELLEEAVKHYWELDSN